MISGFIGLVFSFFLLKNGDTIVDRNTMSGYDFNLFKGTACWNLAKAAEKQDTLEIIKLVADDGGLLSFAEPKFGETLLQLAVKTLKYNTVKTLLNLGADPNIQDKYDGTSPLMEASKILLLDNLHYGPNSKYLELLLKHHGDANAEQKGIRPKGNFTRYTPLLYACSTGYLAYVKILLDAGANINYSNEFGMTPLGEAAISGDKNPGVVLYLLDNGADYRRPALKINKGEKLLYITDWLRNWRFDIGSEKYKTKMQIVEFLKKRGMDYWKTEIPDYYFNQYSKEYLEKY